MRKGEERPRDSPSDLLTSKSWLEVGAASFIDRTVFSTSAEVPVCRGGNWRNRELVDIAVSSAGRIEFRMLFSNQHLLSRPTASLGRPSKLHLLSGRCSDECGTGPRQIVKA